MSPASQQYGMDMLNNLTRFAVAATTFFAIGIQAASAQNTNLSETELIAVLTSDAPKAEKAITCKHLAVHGTAAAVPELVKLLPDEELTSWVRTALEAIPDPAAAAALRDSITTLEGRSLVGVINSVGIGRDSQAVAALIEQLDSQSDDVQSAAAVALGRIANNEARGALEPRLDDADANVRANAAMGCILAAEHLLEAEDTSSAAKLYEKVRSADVPKQRILEATRGSILSQESIPLLVEQLRSTDKDHFGIGVRTAREMADAKVTDALVSVLELVPPARQSVIVLSLTDRDRDSVIPVVLNVAETGSPAVRKSVMQVLGQIGDKSCLDAVLNSITGKDDGVAAAARDALASLPDSSADDEIKARLAAAKGAIRVALLEAVGKRRIIATDALAKAADDKDANVRSAALTALGATVRPDELSLLVDRVVSSRQDREIARKSLLTAAVRMPDREACATQLADAMTDADLDTKCAIVEILGNVGGKSALATVGSVALGGNEDQLRDAASRMLGKWATSDAAPVLFDLAKPTARNKYEVRALRGYLRIARQMKLTPAQRAEMCQNALQIAGRNDERLLALQVLQIHPSPHTLMVAANAKADANVSDEATAAAANIAKKLGIDVEKLESVFGKSGFREVDLHIVKATYGAGDQSKDVTDVVRKRIGKLPVISLGSQSYNAAFGGDPAPGTVKKLAIDYTMDGKNGSATFAENAMILLPLPESR